MIAAAPLFDRADAWPLLLALPVFAALVWWSAKLRRASLARFVDSIRERALCPDSSRVLRRTRFVLLSAAFALSIVALLDPVYGDEIRLLEPPQGVDVMLCVDVSRSMLARDLPPNRLERAKREIVSLADRARGDRLGLVAFAGEARCLVPLTNDRDTFRGLVDPVDPLSVRLGGTHLGRALDTALKALESSAVVEGGESKLGRYEVIVLLTDGEDLEGQGLAVAERAAKLGVTIHCVGFGTTLGSKIASEERTGEAFQRDSSGQEIVTRMDAESLRKIASATGGEFLRADAMPLPLLELYEKRIVPQAKKTYEGLARTQKAHRFQWPLFAAVPLWLASLALTDRRRTRPR